MDYFKDERLKDVLKVLKKEFRPSKVFLFGSRAKGTHTQNSDYDIMLIVEKSDIPHLKRMQQAKLALFDARVHVPTDVFVYTQEEFEKKKDIFDSIPEIVFTEGKELNIASL